MINPRRHVATGATRRPRIDFKEELAVGLRASRIPLKLAETRHFGRTAALCSLSLSAVILSWISSRRVVIE